MSILTYEPKFTVNAPKLTKEKIEQHYQGIFDANPDIDEDLVLRGIESFHKNEPDPSYLPTAEQLLKLGEQAKWQETGVDLGGAVDVLGRLVRRLPGKVAASAISAAKGPSGADIVNPDAFEKFQAKSELDSREFINQVREEYKERKILPGIPLKITDLAELDQSAGFSVTAAGAGLTAGAGATLLAPQIPGAGYVAGMSAAGAAAYQMAGNHFMREVLEYHNELMQATKGRGLNEEEQQAIKLAAEEAAHKIGLWEAIPEAIGSGLGFAALIRPLRGFFGKSLSRRIAARLGGLYGEELITETITEMGQRDVRSEAIAEGMLPEPEVPIEPTEWTNWEQWKQAFYAVAPQTFLLTTGLGAGVKVGTGLWNKAVGTPEREADAAEKVVHAIKGGELYNPEVTERTFNDFYTKAHDLAARRPDDAALQTAVEELDKIAIARAQQGGDVDPNLDRFEDDMFNELNNEVILEKIIAQNTGTEEPLSARNQRVIDTFYKEVARAETVREDQRIPEEEAPKHTRKRAEDRGLEDLQRDAQERREAYESALSPEEKEAQTAPIPEQVVAETVRRVAPDLDLRYDAYSPEGYAPPNSYQFTVMDPLAILGGTSINIPAKVANNPKEIAKILDTKEEQYREHLEKYGKHKGELYGAPLDRTQGPAQGVNIFDVQKAFPGQSIFMRPDNSFLVHFKNGAQLLIKGVQQIGPDGVAVDTTYSPYKEGDPLGSYQDGVIKFVKGMADRWVLHHESGHALLDMGIITPKEFNAIHKAAKKRVEQGLIPESENAEELVMDYLADELYRPEPSTQLQKIIQKIRDWVDKMTELLTGTPTARSVARGIQTGSIFNRPVYKRVPRSASPVSFAKIAPEWYSEMEQKLEQILPKVGTVDEIMQLIQNAADPKPVKKKGKMVKPQPLFKAGELEFSGLMDYLENLKNMTQKDYWYDGGGPSVTLEGDHPDFPNVRLYDITLDEKGINPVDPKEYYGLTDQQIEDFNAEVEQYKDPRVWKKDILSYLKNENELTIHEATLVGKKPGAADKNPTLAKYWAVLNHDINNLDVEVDEFNENLGREIFSKPVEQGIEDLLDDAEEILQAEAPDPRISNERWVELNEIARKDIDDLTERDIQTQLNALQVFHDIDFLDSISRKFADGMIGIADAEANTLRHWFLEHPMANLARMYNNLGYLEHDMHAIPEMKDEVSTPETFEAFLDKLASKKAEEFTAQDVQDVREGTRTSPRIWRRVGNLVADQDLASVPNLLKAPVQEVMAAVEQHPPEKQQEFLAALRTLKDMQKELDTRWELLQNIEAYFESHSRKAANREALDVATSMLEVFDVQYLTELADYVGENPDSQYAPPMFNKEGAWSRALAIEKERDDPAMLASVNETLNLVEQFLNDHNKTDPDIWPLSNAKVSQYAEGQYTFHGGENYRDILVRVPKSDAGRSYYNRTHWGDVGDVIFHIRLDERYDENGNRILFIQEIQSDIHQQARKIRKAARKKLETAGVPEDKIPAMLPSGYHREFRDNEYTTPERAMGALFATTQEYSPFKLVRQGMWSSNENMIKMTPEGRYKIYRRGRPVTGNVFPTGPYKAPYQNNWVNMALRKIVRYAATRKPDSKGKRISHIAWTPGWMQVQRYETELRKQVDRITWEKSAQTPELTGPFGIKPGPEEEIPILEWFNNIEDAINSAQEAISYDPDNLTEKDFYIVSDEGATPLETAKKFADREVRVRAYKNGREVFHDVFNMNRKQMLTTVHHEEPVGLEDMFNDETVDAIRNTDARQGVIEGEGLTIGGREMEDFYDRILPNLFSRMFGKKKYGSPDFEHHTIFDGTAAGVKKHEQLFFAGPNTGIPFIFPPTNDPVFQRQDWEDINEEIFSATSIGDLQAIATELGQSQQWQVMTELDNPELDDVASTHWNVALQRWMEYITNALNMGYYQVEPQINEMDSGFDLGNFAIQHPETGQYLSRFSTPDNPGWEDDRRAARKFFSVHHLIDALDEMNTSQRAKVRGFQMTAPLLNEALFKGFPKYTKQSSIDRGAQEGKGPVRREFEATLRTMSSMMPGNIPPLSFLEQVLRSPEWYSHPVLQKLVHHAINRSDIYNELMSEMLSLSDPFNRHESVTQATKDLKRKGLSPGEIIRGKSSPEYKILQKMIDHGDTQWERDESIPLNEELANFENEWRGRGATDDVINVWKLHREAYDMALDKLIQPMEQMLEELKEQAAFEGKDPNEVDLKNITTIETKSGSRRSISLKKAINYMNKWRGFYAPRLRDRGNYVIQAAKDDEQVRYHRPTRQSAERLYGELKEAGWRVKPVHEIERIPEEVYQSLREMSTQEILDQSAKKLQEGPYEPDPRLVAKFREDLIQEVADLIRARGFRSSMIRRGPGSVVKGYIEDPLERLVRYSSNISAGLAKAQTAQLMVGEVTEGIDAAKDPRAYGAAKRYIEEQLRNQDKIDRYIGLAKSVASIKYLGLPNLRSPFVNLTAMLTTTPPAILQYGLGGKGSFTKIAAGLGKAGKDYAKFMVKGRGNNLTIEERMMLTEAELKGYTAPQHTRDAMGALQGSFGKTWSAAVSGTMYMFGKTEQWNRGTTMLAAYRLGRAAGQDHRTAIERARDATNKAHALYGKATLPAWAQGNNPLAKIGQFAYVYQKFAHNWLQMMYDLGLKRRDIKSFLWAVLSPVFLGGAASIPLKGIFAGIIGAIMKAMGDDRDPERVVMDGVRKTLGETGERAFRFGIVGLDGADISGSMSIDYQIPTELVDLTGAIGGIARDFGDAMHFVRVGEPFRAMETLLPVGAGNLLRAQRESSEGVTTRRGRTLFDERNRPYKPTATETALRAAGFRSSRVATVQARRYELKKEAAKFKARRDRIYEMYRNYLADPSAERRRTIRQKIKEYNRRVRKLDRQREIPLISLQSLRQQARRRKRPTKKGRLR